LQKKERELTVKDAAVKPHKHRVASIAFIASPLLGFNDSWVFVKVAGELVGMDFIAQKGAIRERGAGEAVVGCELPEQLTNEHCLSPHKVRKGAS
jgi:hypothetical protein